MGWVFQGSSDKFGIDDYLSKYPKLLYWRTPRYAKEIAVGDRAFIWRSGADSGAIAIGTVVELPTLAADVSHQEALGDDLYIAEKPSDNKPKTGLSLEEIRLTISQNMVERATVRANPTLASSSLIKAPMGTVFKLSDEQTKAMELLWGIGVEDPDVEEDKKHEAEEAKAVQAICSGLQT